MRLLKLLLLLFVIINASEDVPTKEEVAKLYVATFNRAPDKAGLDYWTNSSGLKLSQIAQSFFDQPETKALYSENTSNRDFVNSVYQNLFNRAPDSDGLDYWENELNTGVFSKNRFIEAVINGAQNTDVSNDATILTNKMAVGLFFAEANMTDPNDARDIMNGITDDSASVDYAFNNFGITTQSVTEVEETHESSYFSSLDYNDYTINFFCNNINPPSTTLKQAITVDFDFLDDDLSLLNKLYNNKKPAYYEHQYPDFAWDIVSDDKTDNNTVSKYHHQTFDTYSSNIFRITCNYANESTSMIFPIKDHSEWKASYELYTNIYRNNLIFYVSHLSDLHSKIYLEEYKHNLNHELAFLKANQFMELTFPGSHYSVELNYETTLYKRLSIYDDYSAKNHKYYRLIDYTSKIFTNGDKEKLTDLIAKEYRNYYLTDIHECQEKEICATFFQSYTKSVTNNENFSDELNSWTLTENYNGDSLGKIEYEASTNKIYLEFHSDLKQLDTDYSIIDLFQTEYIDSNNIDNYTLRFKIDDIYGGNEGFAPLTGVAGSGIAGIYTCFYDKYDTEIGCLIWSDHTDIASLNGLSGKYMFQVPETRYVENLFPLMRRTKPIQYEMLYVTNLGKFTQKNLPNVYDKRNSISSIHYGVFLTEVRNDAEICSKCFSEISVIELNLLKNKVE